MIQAHELRIGNLIYGPSDRVDTVVSILSDDCIKSYPGKLIEAKLRAELKDCTPIPITEQWLIDFGFKPIPHFTIGNTHTFDIGRNRIISISNIGSPNLTMWIQEVNEERTKVNDLICIWNWDYDKELYVHRLQNILHALTGQELTIKFKIT